MFFFKKRIVNDIDPDLDKLPTHIAIIPDGNRRWAKRRGLGSIFGHREGAKRIKEITIYANKIGICFISFYIFSTENWSRTKDEVRDLMNLILEFLKKADKELEGEDIKINIIGEKTVLPDEIKNEIQRIESKTIDNKGICLNIFLNYGSRQEITDAIKKICLDVKAGELDPVSLSIDDIGAYMYYPQMPDPDLMIRTSGELRLSNFLLWQNAYSEFYFSKKLWPDFDTKEFIRSLIEFQKRNRRFGGI